MIGYALFFAICRIIKSWLWFWLFLMDMSSCCCCALLLLEDDGDCVAAIADGEVDDCIAAGS
jgi:hypothetical protein